MHYTLSDYLMDIAHNSVEAMAMTVTVTFSEKNEYIEMVVQDDGSGMDESTLSKAKDPFYTDPEKHAERKVGLGLPFLIQACEACEGTFSIDSQKGTGTTVRCTFRRDCIDTPPLGGLVSAVIALMTMDRDYELIFNRFKDDENYCVKRSELIDALEELNTAASINMARTYVASLEENI